MKFGSLGSCICLLLANPWKQWEQASRIGVFLESGPNINLPNVSALIGESSLYRQMQEEIVPKEIFQSVLSDFLWIFFCCTRRNEQTSCFFLFSFPWNIYLFLSKKQEFCALWLIGIAAKVQCLRWGVGGDWLCLAQDRKLHPVSYPNIFLSKMLGHKNNGCYLV